MMKFQDCLAFTLGAEGGYQCAPMDSGNWSTGRCGIGMLIGTNWGISAPTLIAWRGPGLPAVVTADTMRALPRDVAEAIFGGQYWLPCGGPLLPAGIDLMTFDHAVTSGVHAAVRLLQQAVDVAADGWVGPLTLAAVATVDPARLIDALGALQDRAYRQASGAPAFLTGWLARLERRRVASHALLQALPPHSAAT